LEDPIDHRKDIFIPKYSNLTIGYRDRKCALKASNNGECWWVFQFLTHSPNRIVGKW